MIVLAAALNMMRQLFKIYEELKVMRLPMTMPLLCHLQCGFSIYFFRKHNIFVECKGDKLFRVPGGSRK